jgi:Dihydrofolate reductase
VIGALWTQSLGPVSPDPDRWWAVARRVERITRNSTLLIGRRTWGAGWKHRMPGRRYVVLTSDIASIEATLGGVEAIEDIGYLPYLPQPTRETWVLGGVRTFASALAMDDLIDLIDVTYAPLPDLPAPAIDEAVFSPGPLWGFETEPDIFRRTYVRRTLSPEPYELADHRRVREGGVLRPVP